MIEVYSRRQSYAPGQTAELCFSTDAPTLRYYLDRAGRSSQRVAEGDCAGAFHEIPKDVVANGCGWPVGLSIALPKDLKSGFYILTLQSASGETGETFFVVRAPQPSSAILWVLETNTWNAYNTFGGASTYVSDELGYLGGAPIVSFERPLPKGFISLPETAHRFATSAAGTASDFVAWAQRHHISKFAGSASWAQWGGKFAKWLAREGIEVDYAVNGDLQEFPDLASGYRLILSTGHDEYWSWEMRDTVEAHVANGGNAAFFSGNTAFWQVRLEKEGRQMVAFKRKVARDPILHTADKRRNTSIWSDRLTQRPENTMTGVSFTRGGYARFGGATPASAGGYTIYRPNHWALADTGLSYGDQLGATHAIIGYECDGCALKLEKGLPFPTGEDGTPENFEIAGIAPVALFTRETAPAGSCPDGMLSDLEFVAQQAGGNLEPETLATYAHGHAVMGSFTSPAGGIVFTAGTTDWIHGLEDPAVSRITRNVLDRLAAPAAERTTQ
ncbi:N,N-dimethylformamidase beta subunit family domain-containing protein [Sphingomonas crocodyli]|uniref:N,N-dimethylformamidase beta subunit-like C-terminal domain-containing protein n=1 Tax=Sphingomonas crocodyli TaxID=1979270 RepID=A0A437M5A8_9SPHN|nr:N,N-dimethylformamidase beta subunit family domain-containing protein [Sphingomonas crocodyli]RVT92920.1 hypothetical protein EOD43_03145 [Sphingomonas crocodyli]